MSELERWTLANRARVSALVCEVASGREIAQAQPEQALNPASNQKILTIAAALDLLGPEHRFASLLAGRVGFQGLSELVLRSDGDPELSSESLAGLVESLLARDLKRVTGDLLVDQSAFDALWDPPGYEQRPNDWAAYRAPVSAVAVDRNSVTLFVASETAGKPARVWFEPHGLVTITGKIMTHAKGTAQDVRLTVRPKGNQLEALLGGSVPEGKGLLSFSRRLAAPEIAGGLVLATHLAARAIGFVGRVRAGGAGVQETLAVRRSRPLAQIVHALGKSSDNFTAEMLLKALGAKASGGPGTSAAGIVALEQYLKRHGAWSPGTQLGNGSGLYDANRLSARTLVRVLSAAYGDARVGPELLSSLAIGGVDGTLTYRFSNLRRDRRVRAKTGTLASVTALSGYVLSKRGPLAFAVLLDGIAGKHTEARRRIDALVEAIAQI